MHQAQPDVIQLLWKVEVNTQEGQTITSAEIPRVQRGGQPCSCSAASSQAGATLPTGQDTCKNSQMI